MRLKEQIEAYKLKHRNGNHVFSNGDKVLGNLYTFLDNYYKDAVNEFKTSGTSHRAETLKKLLQ